MEDALLSLGEEACAKLPMRSSEVDALLKNFAPKTLEAIQAEFEAGIASAGPGATNDMVAKLVGLVREQAAQTLEDLKNLDMWLHCKIPAVSDGNNFGVDVQMHVIAELKKLRDEVTAMIDAMSKYHETRAGAMQKIVTPTSITKETESRGVKETGKKDGDTNVKTETTVEKSMSKTEPPLPDCLKYLAVLDTKEYHACYTRLADLRNAYVKANLLMVKNKKRLSDPRGDGEGTRANSMSMF